MLVAEVWRTQLCCSQLAGLAHPQQRSPYEDVGIHDGMVHARGQYAKVVANQSHIVGQGHPAKGLVIITPVGALNDGANINAQVPMRKNHAFRVAGGPRRVLDKRNIVWRRGVQLPMRAGLHIAHEHCVGLEQSRNIGQVSLLREIEQALQQIHFGEQRDVLELRKYAEQLELVFIADANGNRHRHDAAEHGCPECDHKALVGLAEDDQLIARLHTTLLQRAKQRQGLFP